MGRYDFCIGFHRLNAQTKKDAYPLPCMQENHGEHGGHLTLFLYGLEEWVLASQDGRAVQAVHRLYGG